MPKPSRNRSVIGGVGSRRLLACVAKRKLKFAATINFPYSLTDYAQPVKIIDNGYYWEYNIFNNAKIVVTLEGLNPPLFVNRTDSLIVIAEK